MTSLKLLFPGQGAQKVGMGLDFYNQSSAARNVFDRADALLEFSLSQRIFQGPGEQLTRTDMAQPGIFVTSLASLAGLEETLGHPIQPSQAAGLSLGEYTALTAAGALTFADGLRLVHLRGQAMQAASEALPSGMMTVLALDQGPLEALCEEVSQETGMICQVSNLNSPGQIVVSGEVAALDLLEPRVLEAGARRAIRLDVAGAFHSEVMRPAADQLATALQETEFRVPYCPVWQNATAQPETDPDKLRQNLVSQLTAPVLWQESFVQMASTVAEGPFLEMAPGRVLAGLARKISPGVLVRSLDTVEALASFATPDPA